MSAGASPQQSLPDKRVGGWIAASTRHIPPAQFGRYLLVGVWNTVFGYATFALFTLLFSRVMAHGYVAASIVSSLLNITVAYLGYKWFVFKTKGNYIREWTRCVLVYSGAIVVSTLLLPVLVHAIRRWTTYFAAAPYVAGAVLIGATTIYSFLGHKNFSFRSHRIPLWSAALDRGQPDLAGGRPVIAGEQIAEPHDAPTVSRRALAAPAELQDGHE